MTRNERYWEWLVCDECGRGFDVDKETAKEMLELCSQRVALTCGNCDAAAAETERKRIPKNS